MPPEGMKILASPCSSFWRETGPAAARSHTHMHATTHMYAKKCPCRSRAQVAYRDNHVNLKNINTGVWLQGGQGTGAVRAREH